MTVAAVILVPDNGLALVDADGEPAIRRIVQSAWSGGAIPIVIVGRGLDESPGPTDGIRVAIADLQATLSEPGADEPQGIAWFAHGLGSALAAVSDTTAALLWPVRYCWVDPETATSLIEAHGDHPETILRPSYRGEPGFPILVPIGVGDQLAAQSGLHAPDAIEALAAAGVPLETMELGDPGIAVDSATPRSALAAYQGPPRRER